MSSSGEILAGGFGFPVTSDVRSRAVCVFANLIATRGIDSVDRISLRSVRDQLRISESTIFRKFKTKSVLIEFTYDAAWGHINLLLAQVSFIPAQLERDAGVVLERDFGTLAGTFFDDDQERRDLVACALFLHRRAAALGLTGRQQARLFEERVASLCRLGGYDAPDVLTRELISLLFSYGILWNMYPNAPTRFSQGEFLSRLRGMLGEWKRRAPEIM